MPMDPILLNLIVVGLVAVAAGVLMLFAIVHLELAPVLRLGGRRRWLLSLALGSGILALLLKLVLIVTVAYFPLSPVSAERGVAQQAHVERKAAASPVARYRFLTLPEVANEEEHSVPAREDYVWRALPAQAPSPADNPTTPAKVELGRQLFFDSDLSRDGSVSCASCHDVDGLAGGDGRPTSVGIDGQVGPRNAPTVWNAAFQSHLFWDGRAASLEEQARGPFVNPQEMGMPSLAAVEERVRGKSKYRAAFAAVFGASAAITIERIVAAIAAYERTLSTADTPYDRFVRGDADAMTPSQLRGMALFQSLGCINCHFGPNFSAASVFDSRSPRRIFPANPTPYEQRYDLLLEDGTRGVWRVPSLRNVALTGPWLHNGSVDELGEVVRIMAAAQLGRAGRYLLWSGAEGTLKTVARPAPSEQEVLDIVSFLNALSSDHLVSQKTVKPGDEH